MAVTSYGTNDPLAVKLWSKRLAVEVLKNTWAAKFMGQTSDAVIQVKDETTKSAGDKITYGLRMQLTGGGVIGDGTLDGSEEALTTYSDAIIINQLRHAVRSGGKMTQQRVPFNIRDEALSGLRDWWADRIDYSYFNQAGGNLAQTDTRYTGLQATIYPDSSHILYAQSGITTDASLSAAGVYNLTMIDRCVERARTLTPAIRPVMVGGKPFYVHFLHPYCVTDLRTNTASGQWLDIQKAAMTGGEVEDNPIFDGALGVYNGTILHSDYRVPQGCSNASPSVVATSTRRNIFVGAQAAMMGYGRDDGPERYTWVEELFDYENQLGVAAGSVFGMKKTVFNSMDYANIVAACYAVQH